MATPGKPLQNIYYERKVATERPCYICKRPTATVLATIDTKDFLYTCESHLSDRGFATLLTPPAAPAPTPPGPSQEDIRKVIADYKAREAKKGDKDKAKEVDDGREPPLTTSASGSASASPKPTPASPPAASAPPAPAPSHRKFALHRQIFDMRVQEIKRREQGVKAREVGKGLPQVPRGTF